jgi:hypothetical protein
LESRIIGQLIQSAFIYIGGAALALYVAAEVAGYVTHVFAAGSALSKALG